VQRPTVLPQPRAAAIGVQKLKFLVDTGAYPSVIDQKIARRLGLTEQPGRVNLSSKSVPTRLIVLPSLLLRAESLPVLTEDLSFLQKAIGYKMDGIVGLDVLRKTSFSINYRTKEIECVRARLALSPVPLLTPAWQPSSATGARMCTGDTGDSNRGLDPVTHRRGNVGPVVTHCVLRYRHSRRGPWRC